MKFFFKILVSKKSFNLIGQNHFWAYPGKPNHTYLKKLNRSVSYKDAYLQAENQLHA